VAYRAEIEIGVNGAKKLQQVQRNIEKLNEEINNLNAKSIIQNGAVQNLAAFNQNLEEAAHNLQTAALGFDEERRAIEQYVQSLGEANSARDRQNKLIKDQVRAQTEAKAAAIAERTGAKTQYSLPIGPAPAKEMEQVYASLNRLQSRAVDQANNFTEAIGRGTQEVLDLQQAAKRIQGPALPVGFDAEKKAAEVKTRLAEDQSIKEINLRRRTVREVLSDEVDADLQLRKQKLDSNDQVFKDRLAKDNAYGDEWLKTLNRRTEARKKANKEIDSQQRALDKKQRKRRDVASSAAIGFSFPLLFGQGAGAAVGGGLGGLAGGIAGGQAGFALSLVGTQIGSAVDQVVSGAAELGQALNPLTADIGKIAEAAGLAGTETELYLKAIEKNAGKQAALKAATEELAAVVGQDGVAALKRFGQATNNLGNAFNQLLTQLGAGIAEALGGVTEQVAESLSRSAALQAGLGRTDGAIGSKAKEFKTLRARIGKVNSEQQIKDNQRLRELANQIVNIVQNENKERLRTLRITQDLQEKIRGIKDQEAQVQTQLQILDITEQATTKSTEAAELRKQAIELVKRQEDQIASLRIGLEQQVSSIRLQNLSKEAQLRNNQEQLELARLRNRLALSSQAFANSINLSEPGRNFAIALNEAATQFNFALAKGEAARSAASRNTALELERLGVQAEQTKANIRRQVSKLDADFQKQSAELNSKVSTYNLKVSQERFSLEKELVKLQINRIDAETLLLQEKLKSEGQLSEKQKTNFERTFELIEKSREALSQQTAPSKIQSPLINQPSSGVSVKNFDTVITQAESLIRQLSTVQGEIISEEIRTAQITFINNIKKETQSLIEQKTPLDERLQQMAETAEVARLVAEGFSQVQATQIVKGTQAFALLNQELVNSKLELETLIAAFTAIEEKTPAIVAVIETLQASLGGVNQRLNDVSNQSNNFVNSFQKTSKVDKHIESLNNRLADTEAQAIRVADGVGNAVGSSLDSAIARLIEGSANIKEIFADMLKSVGQILVQEGTKMIATYIAIGVAKIFAGLGSATAGGGSSVETITSKYGSFGAEGAAKAAGSLPPLPKANGGPVEGGRPYMVGERGPEMFIPGSSGGIMRNEDMRQMMGRSPAGVGAPQMNFTFETTNIGGTEFVSREQLEVAMSTTRRQAASDGAKQGMSMTLDKMQNSPRTRSRVGIR